MIFFGSSQSPQTGPFIQTLILYSSIISGCCNAFFAHLPFFRKLTLKIGYF
ncbi:hypothetical protein DBT_1751 [Dissulfuribacter thermophilus]|uniref:Uncharacterized protein n=1 Tax=Dissulfuribacter thermophilus TaxID=1156395 RepID=A0A1B9F4V0_9BACT|nr:hypothetical protein DBT_1751 [Dissulfuribacter thermophilus]